MVSEELRMIHCRSQIGSGSFGDRAAGGRRKWPLDLGGGGGGPAPGLPGLADAGGEPDLRAPEDAAVP